MEKTTLSAAFQRCLAIRTPLLVGVAVFGMLIPQMGILELIGYVAGNIPKPPGIAAMHSLFASLIVLAVFVPIYETLLGQWLVIATVEYFVGPRYWISIAISALVFGLSHGYAGVWLFFLIFNGAILAAVFVIQRYRACRPFLTTYVVHAIYNSLSILIQHYS